MHLNSNNVYSNIFSTDQLMNMNTFEAMYEDEHNQIEPFIPISNSQEDMPIMNENINIENELHHHANHHHHHHNLSNDATSTESNIAKNISNLNQILSLTSFEDFNNINNENHHHLNPNVIKMEKINFNNNSHVNNLKCMINLNKISNESNEDDFVTDGTESPTINFKLKDSFGKTKILFNDFYLQRKKIP